MNHNIKIKKINYFAWLIFLIIIFLRPFISSRAYPILELYYNCALTLMGCLFLILGKRKINFNKQDLPIALFLISIVISNFFSIQPLISLGVSFKFIIFIFVFFLTRTLNDYEKKQLIFTIITAAIIISLYAIYQYLFGFRYILDYIAKYKVDYPYAQDFLSRKRVFATFFSPDMLAGYLILIIPLVLGHLLKPENKSRATCYVLHATLVILFISLFLTKSVGAILSLFLGLLIFTILSKQFRKKILFPLLILFIFSLLVIFLRGAQIFNLASPHNPFVQRLLYWRQSIQIVKEHPFLGIGLGNFQIPKSAYAHNSYLQLWAELGILGIFSFLVFIYYKIKEGLSKIRIQPDDIERMAVLTSVVTFLIHIIFDFNLFIPEVALVWWVILSIN